MVKKAEQPKDDKPIDARPQVAVKRKEEKPAKAERDALKLALKGKGLRALDVEALVSASDDRATTAEKLKAYLRDLPKAP